MKIYTIYKATNTKNGKVYIGFSKNWPKRINGHNYDRRYGNAPHRAFYNAIQKYGWESFEWEAIYQSWDFDHTLKVMEPYFIDQYRSWVGFEDCNGYNITRGGQGANGWKRSLEVIEKHRQQMKGRKFTSEHVAKRIASFKKTMAGKGTFAGKKHTEETKKKMSEVLKGKPKSDSHKQAMRSRPQDTQTITCNHCGKDGDYKNMKRWHMDRCKMNPVRLADLDKVVTCDMCGYTANESPNFYRNHNQNCRNKGLEK